MQFVELFLALKVLLKCVGFLMENLPKLTNSPTIQHFQHFLVDTTPFLSTRISTTTVFYFTILRVSLYFSKFCKLLYEKNGLMVCITVGIFSILALFNTLHCVIVSPSLFAKVSKTVNDVLNH